jgi:hypothetical protein
LAERCLLLPLTSHAQFIIQSAVRRYRQSGHANPGIGRSAVRALLRLVWISLRIFGWQATVSRLARFHRDRSLAAGESVQGVLDAVDDAVRHAAAELVLPVRCAERAIAGHQILRAGFGQPATLVVSYRPCPRGFHAYVVAQGRILTDAAEHCDSFLPVACFT